MQLSLSPVTVGKPKPPTEWSSEQNKYVETDPRKLFLDRLHDGKYDWRVKKIVGQTLFFQDTTIDDNAEVYHKNMLEYMQACWKDHLGIVITPDMFWYTLLCELSAIIKSDSEKYRYLFSDSKDKKALIGLTDDPVIMPVDKSIGMLSENVPTEIGKFIPEFTTSTLRSKHAMNVAFCDMCSPYYNYSMLCCGIPAIDILGTIDDYSLMKSKWDDLSKIFDNQKLASWFKSVSSTLQSILDNFTSSEFWLDMFRLEKCGSGSDVEVEGWITKFFRNVPEVRYIENYTSGVAIMDYKNLFTKKNYKMQEGLFFSRMEGDFLVPQFGFTVHEIVTENK